MEANGARAKDAAAMRSTVNWALLGLVIERTGHGYQLLKRYQRSYGELVPISSSSHVYSALGALLDRDMIERVAGARARTPVRTRPKQRYQATAKGVYGYRDWLIAQVRSDRLQPCLFVRLLACLTDMPEIALEIIEHYQRACLAEQADSAEAAASDRPDDGVSSLTVRLLREESRLATAARLPWISYARQQFEALREIQQFEALREIQQSP